MIDLEKLATALMNATKPDYELHITCPHCHKQGTTDNGEWLLWCGSEEHAQVMLDASRAYLEQQRAGK